MRHPADWLVPRRTWSRSARVRWVVVVSAIAVLTVSLAVVRYGNRPGVCDTLKPALHNNQLLVAFERYDAQPSQPSASSALDHTLTQYRNAYSHAARQVSGALKSSFEQQSTVYADSLQSLHQPGVTGDALSQRLSGDIRTHINALQANDRWVSDHCDDGGEM